MGWLKTLQHRLITCATKKDLKGIEAPPVRPEQRELGAVSLADRWSSYPSRGLTPQRLAQIFWEADGGSLRSQAELFEEMEEKDCHLFSLLQTRRLAVLGLEWEIKPATVSKEDQAVADFVREALSQIKGSYNSAVLRTALVHLLDAVGKGYSACEIHWGYEGGRVVIVGLTPIHAKKISFVNSVIPLVCTEDNPEGMEPAPYKLLYHSYKGKSGHDTRNGLLRVVAYMYLFKKYALNDWATFNEIFGMPLRLGKYDPSATALDREALKEAIKSLGSDAAGIISKNTEIEFVEAGQRLSGKSNPFELLVLFCNREMSKAILGQTLTVDTEGSTGTYAAARVQAEVRRDLLEADAESLASTITEQLVRPLVGFNFGWDRPIPAFVFQIKEEEDLKAVSETYKNLAEIGYPIPVKHISARFGIALPQEDEEVVGGHRRIPGKVEQFKGQRPHPLGEGGGLKITRYDRRTVEVQGELENLTQMALKASAAAAAQMMAPIRELIKRGSSLEALRDRLLEAYGEMNTQDLEEVLYQAMVLANLRGRLE